MHKMTDWWGRDFALEDVLTSVGPGWRELVKTLIDDLFVLGWNGQLHQIKEKFGGLRFYINDGSKEIHARISAAEDESFRVCENCGNPGSLRNFGWLFTRCDACLTKHH